MKILLIFTFFLISVVVVGFDVIGYTKGRVIIKCNKLQDKGNEKYFCRESTNQCVFLKPGLQNNTWILKGKFGIIDTSTELRVLYRNLSLDDPGSYRCGETGGWNHTVNLIVKKDSCCLASQTVTGNLGETITINCSYPEEFEKSTKYLYKLESRNFTVMINSSESQRGRFSISEDRRSKVFSVRISDVRGDDGGVYSCGAARGNPRLYFSLYSEIHLQVSVPLPPSSSSSSYVIITVSICVVLLLIGGLTLIFYKLRCSKTEADSAYITQTSGTNNTNDDDYENDSHHNISMSPVSPSQDSTFNQSDSLYQNLKSSVNQSDSVYQSPDPNTNQSDSIYQSLDPNTNQSDSIYQSLDPNTNQSDSIYQSLNSSTNQ